jgi:hypothetical protein
VHNFISYHIDIGDLNNKCLNESIFNNDKTDFDYLNYKCLNESIFNNDKTDFDYLNYKYIYYLNSQNQSYHY